MNISLKFNRVSGSLHIPASKSMTQRFCAAALLHNGRSIIRNYGHSDDEQAAIDIIQNLGAKVSFPDSGVMVIDSEGSIQNAQRIDCGESGLSARLFTPIAALYDHPVTIAGKGSLIRRPMHFLGDVLLQLNVSITDFNGYIPFSLCGPLQAKNIVVDGSLSSQFISGLLFAFAHAAKKKTEIEVKSLVSRPYIDLTLEVLALFGKKIGNQNYEIFTIEPGSFYEVDVPDISIESDWSSAAFWIAAATINGALSLTGLNRKSAQADKIILEIVENVGAVTRWENDDFHISSGNLNAFNADLTNAPDLFPVLAVLAACCNGDSKLTGLNRLIHKESNRAESITHLLSELGVPFSVELDTLIVSGPTQLNSIEYNCPNDHRMAMAAALASMKCSGKVEIENAECVHKSYPDFWKDMKKFTQQS
ncbi:MAG: 3-phosphoshikimate 1-carboxyvinyltransferase [Bacteroidota bacterium]